MNQNFKNCLDRGSIYTDASAKKLIDKELTVAANDLEEAQDRFDNGKYKYCTIASYYAMFHAARALLYSKGYKERSHRCLVAALETLFAKDILEPRQIRNLINAMSLREDADYADEYSESGAQKALKNSEEFIKIAQEILKNR